MLVLLFEVVPHPGHEEHYLSRAAELRPRLAAHPGLLFLERYRSLAEPNRILSHQLWADEAALAAWRADAPHRQAQRDGRNVHFAAYRIRVASVLARRATSPDTFIGHAGASLPDLATSAAPLPGEPAPGRLFTLLAYDTGPGPDDAAGEGDHYRSIYDERRHVTVRSVADVWDGNEGLARHVLQAPAGAAMLCRTIRDYGLEERREAPQSFPLPGAMGA